MNNIKKVEAWEYILRRYVKSERDVEQTISKIGNDLRKDRAFVDPARILSMTLALGEDEE